MQQPVLVSATRTAIGKFAGTLAHISAQELGQVSASGQYVPADGGRAQLNQEFTLQQVNRQWRITTLPAPGASK